MLKKRGKNKAKRAKDNNKKKRKPPNKWNKIIVASIAAILWLDPQKKVSSRQNIERGQQQPPNKSDRSRGICWYFFFFFFFFLFLCILFPLFFLLLLGLLLRATVQTSSKHANCSYDALTQSCLKATDNEPQNRTKQQVGRVVSKTS